MTVLHFGLQAHPNLDLLPLGFALLVTPLLARVALNRLRWYRRR